MFAVDWSMGEDEEEEEEVAVVRYGLFFGTIFQLICIGAAIFLPSKSNSAGNSASGSPGGDRRLFTTEDDADNDTDAEYQLEKSGSNVPANSGGGGGRLVTQSRRQQHSQPETPKRWWIIIIISKTIGKRWKG